MRCIACDKNLNDFESTRKYTSGEFIDLCNGCYGEIKDEVLAIEREDLNQGEQVEESETPDFKEWSED